MLRQKQPFNDFFNNALDKGKMMSIDEREEWLVCDWKNLIAPSENHHGWHLPQRNSKKSSMTEANTYYYTLSEKISAELLSVKAIELCSKNYIRCDILNFDDWKRQKTEFFRLQDNGTYITCSCSITLLQKFCKHSVGLMIKLKILNVPI